MVEMDQQSIARLGLKEYFIKLSQIVLDELISQYR